MSHSGRFGSLATFGIIQDTSMKQHSHPHAHTNAHAKDKEQAGSCCATEPVKEGRSQSASHGNQGQSAKEHACCGSSAKTAHAASTDAATSLDPVCGMTVSDSSPHFATHAGQRYVFCSAGCR